MLLYRAVTPLTFFSSHPTARLLAAVTLSRAITSQKRRPVGPFVRADASAYGSMPLPPLDYKEPLVIPARSEHSATVFLLHGLGDTCDGWSPVASKEMWGQNLPHVKFILPTAPVRSVTLNAGFPFTAWYDVTSLSEDDHRTDEEGIQESIRFLADLVEREIQMGIKPERIVVAGFSQGGAMALTMLRSPQKFAAIIGMSCYLPRLSDGPIVSEANKKTPVFMCHGCHDPTIAVTYGKLSFQVLEKEVENIQFEEYVMGHQACQRELQDVQRFLESVLPRP